MSEGTVNLPLDQYLAMEDELREYREIKADLQTAREKIWEIFGKFFQPKRKIEVLREIDPINFTINKQYRLRYDNPITTLMLNHDSLIDMTDDAKRIIITTLIEHHISDVIKNIDFNKADMFKPW